MLYFQMKKGKLSVFFQVSGNELISCVLAFRLHEANFEVSVVLKMEASLTSTMGREEPKIRTGEVKEVEEKLMVFKLSLASLLTTTTALACIW